MIKVKQRAYKEKIESIFLTYTISPAFGDLEPGSRVITRTSEAIGLGLADYAVTRTFPASPDLRVEIMRLAARLNVQGTVIGTPNLRCRVYVDAQVPANMLFDSTIGATLNYLEAVDMHAGALATPFTLLRDGGSHTLHFFLWDPAYVGGTHQYTVTVAQPWILLGTAAITPPVEVLRIHHIGLMSLNGRFGREGTGTATFMVVPNFAHHANPWIFVYSVIVTGHITAGASVMPSLVAYNPSIFIHGTVATDINVISSLMLTLRREE